MSDEFPYLAIQAANERYNEKAKTHAMPTALAFGWARAVCGLKPIDPRTPHMPMDEQRALPRFADVPDKQKCGHCVRKIYEMERADQ